MRVHTIIACVALLSACGSPSVERFSAPEDAVAQISHAEFQALLQRYVDPSGDVDYARWHQNATDIAALDAYLGALSHASPRSRPELFVASSDRLSYWLNLYNALVLRTVLRHWPLDSVRDIKPTATAHLKAGKGFFYDLKFEVDGEVLNLLDIENEIIRAQFQDARIHFALNCASASCPLLRNSAFDGATLDKQLDEATRAFVAQPENVVVDAAAKKVRVSQIFEWYEDDFVAHAQRVTGDPGASTIDFVRLFADDTLARQLDEAKAAGYKLRFFPYDWAVNAGTVAAPQPTGPPAPPTAPASTHRVGTPLPPLSLPLLAGGIWRSSSTAGRVLVVDVWATYCKPCRASMPKLDALARRLGPQGLTVIGIAQDPGEQPVAAFVRDLGIGFPIALDPEQSLTADPLRVGVLPTELVVDRRGIVRFRHEGASDLDSLEREVITLLAEEPAPN